VINIKRNKSYLSMLQRMEKERKANAMYVEDLDI
jgi:hypothetical protein